MGNKIKKPCLPSDSYHLKSQEEHRAQHNGKLRSAYLVHQVGESAASADAPRIRNRRDQCHGQYRRKCWDPPPGEKADEVSATKVIFAVIGLAVGQQLVIAHPLVGYSAPKAQRLVGHGIIGIPNVQAELLIGAGHSAANMRCVAAR